MQNRIHPTAIIDPGANIADSAIIGSNCIIGPKVTISEGVRIGANSIIDCNTTIGEGCNVFSHVVLGTEPQDLKFRGEESFLIIGPNTTIREFVTVNRGTEGGGAVTRVGEGCLLMAYSHVAHDCQLGNNVILANAVNLGGHIHIAEHAIIGGLSAIHQFVSIGEHAFIGGCSAVSMDVPPYVRAVGNRARIFGVNSVGLERKGFPKETITQIKKAYRYLTSSKMNTAQALEAIEKSIPLTEEIQKILTFIRSSNRGICK
ncbi:MAG: acyl-ACP--UDP-N-acetylglucosamine O-acyltransferase [bacterium]